MAAARVQTTGITRTSTAGTITASFGSLPAIGSLIIVGVRGTGSANWADGDVTDNQGNNYDLAIVNNAASDVAIFYTVVTTSSGTFTVSVNPAALGNTQMTAGAVEYSGLWNQATCVDQTLAQTNASSTAAGTGTTGSLSATGEVVAAVMAAALTATSITVETVSPAWSEEYEELSVTFGPGEFDTRVVSSTAGQACNWTLGEAHSSFTAIATFKEFASSLVVPKGSLTITGKTPTVTPTNNSTPSTGKGSLVVTGRTATVTATTNSVLSVPVGALAVVGTYVAIAFLQPAAGHLVITGAAPTVLAVSADVVRTPGAGTLHITGQPFTNNATTGAGTLRIIGHAPSIGTGISEFLRVTYLGNMGTAGPNAHNLFTASLGAFQVGLRKSVWPIAGDLENLIVRLSIAPGPAASRTYAVIVNGASVASVTLSDGASEGRIDGVVATLAPDDLVYLEETATGSPAASAQSWLTFEFISAVENAHAYSGNMGLFGGSTRYVNPFYPMHVEAAFFATPVATPVTMTGISLSSHFASLTGGDGIIATVYVSTDGGDTYVAQDGSGGTPDTTTTLVDEALDAVVSSDFVLSLNRGDMVYIEVVPQGSLSDWFSMATSFLATVDGEVNYARGDSSGDPSPTLNSYTRSQSAGSISWHLAEDLNGDGMYAGTSGFVLKEPYGWALTPPGSGAARRLNLRRNFEPTDVTMVHAGILTPVLADGKGAQSFADGDIVTVQHVPIGSPAVSGGYRWTYIMAAALPDDRDPPSPGGTVVPGERPGAAFVPEGILRRFFTLTKQNGDILGAADTDFFADPDVWFGGYKPAELISVAPVERELSRTGEFRGVEVRVLLDDTKRRWRTLAEQEAISTAFAAIYVVDDDTRYALGEPYRIFAGRVVSHEAQDDLQYELILRDVLTERIAQLDTAPRIPNKVLTESEFPGLYDRTEGKAAPILIGNVSDEDQLVPQGVVPPLIVAGINLSYFGGINQPVIACLWSMCALARAGVWEVFYNPPHLPSTRIRVPNSAYGTDIWTPGRAGWAETGLTTEYVEYPLPIGANTRRYTPVFLNAASPLAEPFLNEGVLVAGNMYGIAEEADGDGLYISDPSRVWQWLLVNQLFVPYTTGDYAEMPSNYGLFEIIDSDMVERTRTRQHLRVNDGYPVGFMVGRDGQQQTVRHILQELCVGTDMQQGINRHGQLIVDTEDNSALPVAELSDLMDILQGDFSVRVDRDWYFNRMERYHGYRYIAPSAPNPVPAEGEPAPKPINDYNPWLSGVVVNYNQDSIDANHGQVKTLVFENYVVREDAVAQNIATVLLDRAIGPSPSYDGPRVFKLRTTLQKALLVELGDNIRITHVDGYGTSGYVGKLARVMKISLDTDAWTAVIEGYILAEPDPDADPPT